MYRFSGVFPTAGKDLGKKLGKNLGQDLGKNLGNEIWAKKSRQKSLQASQQRSRHKSGQKSRQMSRQTSRQMSLQEEDEGQASQNLKSWACIDVRRRRKKKKTKKKNQKPTRKFQKFWGGEVLPGSRNLGGGSTSGRKYFPGPTQKNFPGILAKNLFLQDRQDPGVDRASNFMPQNFWANIWPKISTKFFSKIWTKKLGKKNLSKHLGKDQGGSIWAEIHLARESR